MRSKPAQVTGPVPKSGRFFFLSQEIDPNDLDLFNKFVPDGPPDPILPSINRADGDGDGHGTNLAELILEKIAAHEAAQAEEPVVQGGGPPEDAVELPAKVVEVYSKYATVFL